MDSALRHSADSTLPLPQKRVVLHEGTLDLELHFDVARVLQVLPTSSGYEGWTVDQNSKQFIAVGGGRLAIFETK